MERTIEYLKDLRDDVYHSVQKENVSIQVNSNDLRHIDEALEDIRNQENRYSSLRDELINLSKDFRGGHIGEMSDSFLVDEMLSILMRY